MAEVFLAQQRGSKVSTGASRSNASCRTSRLADFMKMFLGEAKLAAQLSHPNIVHIYEFGKVEGDLSSRWSTSRASRRQLFQEKERFRDACRAHRRRCRERAALAHELRAPSGSSTGIVPRDVSPANIMVSYDGVVKLCDFGMRQAAALSEGSPSGQVKGKYAYMSPEQTNRRPVDGRSDVFRRESCCGS